MRIAVRVERAKHRECRDEHDAEADQPPRGTGLTGEHQRSGQVSQCHHRDPGHQRIHQEHRQVFEWAGHMQEAPEHREAACALRGDSIEEIVPQDQRERERGDGHARQTDQPGEHHHRGPDHPDDLRDQPLLHLQVEVPSEADHRELQQDQPQPSAQQQPRQLVRRPPGARDPGAGTGEEDEGRRAEVGNPTGEEQRHGCLGEVRRIEPDFREVGSHVIQDHDHHDQTPHEVHPIQAHGPDRKLGQGLRTRLECDGCHEGSSRGVGRRGRRSAPDCCCVVRGSERTTELAQPEEPRRGEDRFGRYRLSFFPRERGGTGRRAGLRILSRKGSGFDSRRSHPTT